MSIARDSLLDLGNDYGIRKAIFMVLQIALQLRIPYVLYRLKFNLGQSSNLHSEFAIRIQLSWHGSTAFVRGVF